MLIYTKTYIDKDTKRTVIDTKHYRTVEEQAEQFKHWLLVDLVNCDWTAVISESKVMNNGSTFEGYEWNITIEGTRDAVLPYLEFIKEFKDVLEIIQIGVPLNALSVTIGRILSDEKNSDVEILDNVLVKGKPLLISVEEAAELVKKVFYEHMDLYRRVKE